LNDLAVLSLPFFEYGRLRSIPVQRKKKLICYGQIATHFEIGKVYEEKEVYGPLW
jgi:hypothetical protein